MAQFLATTATPWRGQQYRGVANNGQLPSMP